MHDFPKVTQQVNGRDSTQTQAAGLQGLSLEPLYPVLTGLKDHTWALDVFKEYTRARQAAKCGVWAQLPRLAPSCLAQCGTHMGAHDTEMEEGWKHHQVFGAC